MKNRTTRITVDLLMLTSVFLFPWWVTVLLMVTALLFSHAPEIIVIGFLLDALYGIPLRSLYGFEFVYTALSIAFVVAAYYIKQRLLFYTE